jgi:hypothetical protein
MNLVKESKIPGTIKEDFAQRYPVIEVKKWTRTKETFIAKFKLNGHKLETTYHSNGNWVQTEIRIKWEELPSAARKFYYASEFRWLNQTSTKKIQTPENNELYLIEGDNKNQESGPICRFKLWFSENGEVIKEESGC